MKRLFLIITACTFSFNIFAQEMNVSDTADVDSVAAYEPNIEKAAPDQLLNIVKINATALVFKNFSFQYERILNRKMSVAFGIRFMPNGNIPFKGAIENSIIEESNDDDAVASFIRDADMNGIAFTPEFRYYFGKGWGRGFYVAPFLRYQNFKIESVYPYVDDDGKETKIGFTGNNKTLGAGILLGWQFRLSDRIGLDWWVLGPYYGANTLTLSADNLNLSNDDVASLREDLDETELLWFDISSNVTNTTVDIEAKGGIPLLRGMGLCLTVKF